MKKTPDRIASFSVDHDVICEGIYISRIDGDITTYDMRTRVPNAGSYMDNLTIFVQNLRTDLGVTEAVPFIAGELGQWRPVVSTFNEMIHHISEYIPNSDWVSSEGGSPIASPDPNGEPNLKDPHFDRASQLLIGERYAEKVLKMCY